MSGPTGTVVICAECIEPLERQLLTANDQFAQCDTLESLLSALLRAAVDVTHADMGNIQLIDQNGTLRIRVHKGFQREFLEFFSSVEPNEAACGTALADRRTVAVGDIERSTIFLGTPSLNILRNAKVRAVQSTPIFSQDGQLVGIISTHCHAAHDFAETELKSVALLAARAAQRIEKLTLAQR